MSREGEFMVYATEIYRAAKRLTGREVMELFDSCEVMQFLVRFFDTLHVQGDANIVAEIDDWIASRRDCSKMQVEQGMSK